VEKRSGGRWIAAAFKGSAGGGQDDFCVALPPKGDGLRWKFTATWPLSAAPSELRCGSCLLQHHPLAVSPEMPPLPSPSPASCRPQSAGTALPPPDSISADAALPPADAALPPPSADAALPPPAAADAALPPPEHNHRYSDGLLGIENAELGR
jgi:hypothetical protein